MSGSLYLYISNIGKVYKIPRPIYSDYKAVPNLANQEILMAVLMYKTLNRKPFELELVSFHRDTLDKDGILTINIDDIVVSFESAESLAESGGLIPLPAAPKNIPTSIEKNALYEYVKKYYPALWSNCSYLVEQHIKNISYNFNKDKEFVKKVYKIRNNNHL